MTTASYNSLASSQIACKFTLRIGSFISKFRWFVLIGWLIAAGALALVAPADDPTVGESADLLPPDTPVHVALNELANHFKDKSDLSAIVIVIERKDSALTPADLGDLEKLEAAIKNSRPDEGIAAELNTVSFRSPSEFALAGSGNPLISDDGHGALLWISLPYNFITKQAIRLVKHTQDVVANFPFQPGLVRAVTGSAGYGYDYTIATERSHNKTAVVTLIAVITILLLVYRSPVAAMIPLAGISVAAAVVFKLLAIAGEFGLQSGTAEQIFTFVLLYGAGVDYSLLFMSRYREFMEAGMASERAMIAALDASFSAIASSVAMTVTGLAMLCFARFSVFRNSGPAVVAALLGSAAAAATLVPAIVAIIGPRTFWPANRTHSENAKIHRSRTIWPAIAGIVVKYPKAIMAATLLALIAPAIRGAHVDWNYDALTSLKPTYQARQGTEIVERHWPTGETAPVTVLAVADHPQTPEVWQAVCAKMLAKIRTVADVANVRGLSMPLGIHGSAVQNSAALLLAHAQVTAEYVSEDKMAMRLSVVLKVPPLSRAAFADLAAIRDAASRAIVESNLPAHVALTGSTAEMIDLQSITLQDFWLVAGLALPAILIVVTAVLRDIFVSSFILAATVLSYLTTLGLTYWWFQFMGTQGLEWKVQMLLFIVLIAVGQDYSIFFCMRLAQEGRNLPCAAATRQAMIHTGPVISSCGLIMAATLGSVMAGDVTVLVQLGFAFVVGMLIDTFIVRPLILPAFIVLTGRTLQKAVTLHIDAHENVGSAAN